jgi:hypothetical protein
MIRRHPVALAAIARHVLTGSLEGARQGYRTARSELGEQVPPHAIDAALSAYREEGRRLAAAVRAAELVERALRGPSWLRLVRTSPAAGDGFEGVARVASAIVRCASMESRLRW